MKPAPHFIPQDTQFEDDACHRTGHFSHVETWYYDAVFDNGYSIVSLINVIHIGRVGSVLSGIFIYKDGTLLKSIRNRYPLRKFHGSEKTLLLKINTKELVKGIMRQDNQWVYQINRGDTQNGFTLQFIKTMKPFQGKTYLGNWLAIPGFTVTGTLYVDGNPITVNGEGYHDHNIYPVKAPFVTKGYYFGKLPLSNAKIIWAQIKKSRQKKQTLVVLSTKDSVLSIHPDHITFTIEEERRDHRKIMPYRFSLTVDDPDLMLDIQFDTETYHHIGILAAHYWRYHVLYKGTYQINGRKESIHQHDVAEYLKFF